jgi:hypothetical protein
MTTNLVSRFLIIFEKESRILDSNNEEFFFAGGISQKLEKILCDKPTA